MAAETSTTQEKPRLFTIPPELRNRIYVELFKETKGNSTIDPQYRLPAILKTCKQIYNETIKLYYSVTTFECIDDHHEPDNIGTRRPDLDVFTPWLRNMPVTSRSCIRSIRYATQADLPDLAALRNYEVDDRFRRDSRARRIFMFLRLNVLMAESRLTNLLGIREDQIQVPWAGDGEAKWKWTALSQVKKEIAEEDKREQA